MGFWITALAPGNPVERLSTLTAGKSGNESINNKYWENKLGLNLPLFYFAILSLDEPDTLYRLSDRRLRRTLEHLYQQNGNWIAISKYHHQILNVESFFIQGKTRNTNLEYEHRDQALEILSELRYLSSETAITSQLASLSKVCSSSGDEQINDACMILSKNCADMFGDNKSWSSFIPRVVFYPANQFHRWMFGDGRWYDGKDAVETKGIIRGDFGISLTTKEPVSTVLGSRLKWSVLFAFISVVLSYLISIPLGAAMASRKDSMFDRSLSSILFMLFSLPSFWVGTLLLLIFANPDLIYLFPASGVKPIGYSYENAGFLEILKVSLPYLILPLLCYMYSQISYLSQLLRASMIDSLKTDYIRTAISKGLTGKQIIYKHALRNSLLPMITVLANVFPLAIGGSLIIETIFSIPGMGTEIVQAVYDNNFPMITAVFVISGVLTILGFFISDLLYCIVDPRIKLNK